MPKQCQWLIRTLGCLLLMVISQSPIFAQINVTGKVTGGTSNSPVAGASIVVKGTTTGSQTDADGAFSITVPSNSSIIVVSAVGYKT